MRVKCPMRVISSSRSQIVDSSCSVKSPSVRLAYSFALRCTDAARQHARTRARLVMHRLCQQPSAQCEGISATRRVHGCNGTTRTRAPRPRQHPVEFALRDLLLHGVWVDRDEADQMERVHHERVLDVPVHRRARAEGRTHVHLKPRTCTSTWYTDGRDTACR